MPSITSTGVGSGLDVGTIVTSLMTLEKRPLVLLQDQASTIQTRMSAFGTLKSQLANLGDVAARLTTASNWNTLRVDSGNTDAVTASASAKATAGRHTLAISQLARAQVLASAGYAASTSVVGTGKLTVSLGTTSGSTFTPRTGTTPVTISIDAAHQTLAGVRDAINAANSGLTASIVNGNGVARLVVRGSDGADSSVRISVADDDGNSTDASGLSALAWDPAAPAASHLTQTQSAQDAMFELDGIALTSATNTPPDVLDGVSLTLKQVTASAFDLNVAVETMAVKKNVNDFVNAYNAVNKLLLAQTQSDPTGKSNGPLQADSTAVSLLGGLREMLHGAVDGLTGTNSLTAAGIELQRDGSLQVVDSRLAPLLQNPGQLASLFSQAGTGAARGFGVRYKQWAQALTNETSTLTGRIDGLKQRATANQKQQDAQQERLDRTEQRLRAQYQRLDTQMSGLQAKMKQMSASLGIA